MDKKIAAGIAIGVLICGLGLWMGVRERIQVKPINELKVRITGKTQIPDPAHIESTGDWYYLDHISSGLSFFDSNKKEFQPLLAESWINGPDGTHRFRLRTDIHFHDGTPITAKDVLWTFKRQLLRRTSTHFPLWEYVVGCEGLRTLEDDCAGLSVSGQDIVIRLKHQTESFFLQVASPETGIWSADDMNPTTFELRPTKFSGAYSVASFDENSALLKRNEYSPISKQFSNSPRAIRVKRVPLAKIDDALKNREIDLAIRLHNALGEQDWKKSGIETRSTTPSGIVHFFGLNSKTRPSIGRDFVEAAWSLNQDPVLTPAKSFLPFETNYGLKDGELLASLPATTARKIRVFCPEGYFTQAFLDQLQRVAHSVGSEIEYHFAPSPDWFKAFEDPKSGEKYDYMLTIYAASERYPAVQLRYVTGSFAKPPLDLKKAESPDLTQEQVELLRDYEKWLLSVQQTVPLYFTVTTFLHQKNIDIGDQPQSDAEIELWRVQGK